MARSVEEWIGASDDSKVPNRVKLRVLDRNQHQCQICTRKIRAGYDRFVCDHIVAIINKGENRENNLQSICEWCDRTLKTPKDVRLKSRAYQSRKNQFRLEERKHKWGYGRNDPFKKKIGGRVVPR